MVLRAKNISKNELMQNIKNSEQTINSLKKIHVIKKKCIPLIYYELLLKCLLKNKLCSKKKKK